MPTGTRPVPTECKPIPATQSGSDNAHKVRQNRDKVRASATDYVAFAKCSSLEKLAGDLPKATMLANRLVKACGSVEGVAKALMLARKECNDGVDLN